MAIVVGIAGVIAGAVVLCGVGVLTLAVCAGAELFFDVLGSAWDRWFRR